MGKRFILFLAKYDCANVLTEWSQALNNSSKIYESKVVCLTSHVFKYPLKHDLNIQNLTKKNKTEITQLREWHRKSEFIVCSLDNVIYPQQMLTMSL